MSINPRNNEMQYGIVRGVKMIDDHGNDLTKDPNKHKNKFHPQKRLFSNNLH